MKLIKGVLLSVAVAGTACSLHAQDYTTTTPEQAQPTPPPDYGSGLYHADEFSVDGSVIGALNEHYFYNGNEARRHYKLGGDLGVNYFITRYIGVGGDAYAVSTHDSFVDTTMGYLVFRVPIGPVAPYIFGGAGYQFQGIDQLVGGGGVGVEVRLVEHFSIFADARYLAAAKSSDYGVGRAGVRLSF
jgi:hypothetical protein